MTCAADADDLDTIELRDVARLNLNPGDTLVVTMDEPTSPQVVEQVRQRILAYLGDRIDDAHLLVVAGLLLVDRPLRLRTAAVSGIVYRPRPDHECAPPSTTIEDLGNKRHPAGTVWQCDCDRTWVSRGMVKPHVQTGHVSAGLEWKPESRRARRKRERQGVTPEQVWPGDYEVKSVATRPTEVATPIVPNFHNRDITDRLKAAERCVLAATEALTGETHDGIYDYDQAREHLLSVIQARACPVQQPADPVE
jgi:hypothetical protein